MVLREVPYIARQIQFDLDKKFVAIYFFMPVHQPASHIQVCKEFCVCVAG